MKVVTAVGATPNRMRILYEFLAHSGEKGAERSKLAALLAPTSLAGKEDAGEDNAFADCLSAGDELRIFRREDDRILLVQAPQRPELEEAFREQVERGLLPTGRSEGEVDGAFAGAVSWMLCQDPSQGLRWSGSPGAITVLRTQIGEDGPNYDLTNDSRFQQAAYWARFLGFVSRLKLKGEDIVVPDPTRAIERLLDAALPRGVEKPVAAFMVDLARLCPVLEGGRARIEFEERLPPGMRREDRVLSASTALALLRLKNRGSLAFRRLDDGQVFQAEGLGDDGRVTHVRRVEGPCS
jgi:hypothetical protein